MANEKVITLDNLQTFLTKVKTLIPSALSQLTNDVNYITNNANNLVNYYSKTEIDTKFSNLSSVATSGSYNDLSDTPSLNYLPLSGGTMTGDVAFPITQNAGIYFYANGGDYFYKWRADTIYQVVDGASYELSFPTKSGTFALTSDLSNYYTKTATDTLLANKVDKVSGKGLSANDFTTSEKNKLSGIESEAQVNVIESISKNGTAITPSNKNVNIVVPTKTSDLTNDSNYITKSVSDLTNYTTTSGLNTLLSNYMPLSGGTFTGAIYFPNSTALPNKSLSYVCGIDAFASGGQMGWQSKSEFLSGYATTSQIPTKTSQLTNDSGFLTSLDVIGKQDLVSAMGSSTQPVYVKSFGTFATASTYAGGTKITLNGTDKGGTSATIYAPTSAITTSTAKRYLVGTSSTTAVSTENTNANCYMSGGYLYSNGKVVANPRTLYIYMFSLKFQNSNDNVALTCVGFSDTEWSDTATVSTVLEYWNTCFGSSFVSCSGVLYSAYYKQNLNVIDVKITSSSQSSATIYFHYHKPYANSSISTTNVAQASSSASYIYDMSIAGFKLLVL